MGKKNKKVRGRKVSLKFFINAEDLTELQEDLDNFEEFEEFEDGEIGICKSESFVINDYITMKFEDQTTQIYINGKRFMQCIRLILRIPLENVRNYDEVKSIDDAIDINRKSLYRNEIVEGPWARPVLDFSHNISPEEEFRGHCSNIQTWAENNYNTCILHSNIAFPMLKVLTKAGDPLAKRVFKEEIAIRYEMGNEKFRQYLIELGYMKYLSHEELITLLEEARERVSITSNQELKKYENSHNFGVIKNFVDYYDNSKDIFNEKKCHEFLKKCNKTFYGLYIDTIKKNNEPQLYKDVKQLVAKRRSLYRELQKLKEEIHDTGKLWEFLKTLEVLIQHLDPNLIVYHLNSFKIES